MEQARALHYVLKVGNRSKSVNFYTQVLQMKTLRHEEFKKGCEATCNGPYDGAWSKTMIGYGSEDTHFVLELTYNYGVSHYTHGNDFQSITICHPNVYDSIKSGAWEFEPCDEHSLEVVSPCGYRFTIVNRTSPTGDPVTKVSISSSNLKKSLAYWQDVLGMQLVQSGPTSATLAFDKQRQAHLELVSLLTSETIDRASAFGRIAFSIPCDKLASVESKVEQAGHTILTPLISLETPSKATVQVVILADVDNHEICFVGDEAFRQLSAMDPSAADALTDAITSDKSDQWFSSHGGKQSA